MWQELIEDVSSDEAPPEINVVGIELALRYLGRQRHGVLSEIIEHALDEPTGPAALALSALTRSLHTVEQWTAKERALALWAVIEEGVKDHRLGPTIHSRKRHALAAALRLPIEGIPADAWHTSLNLRFKQLKAFPAVFADPSTLQPMEVAWSSGVKVLATYLGRRFEQLQSVEDWEPYRPHDKPMSGLDDWVTEYDARVNREHTILRAPSEHAQKVFADLIVVTVQMRGHREYRRVTERLVTSRDPRGDVAYFTAKGFRTGENNVSRTYVPVRGVWGCTEEVIESERAAPVTRLWFPKPLTYSEQAYFASEMTFDHADDGDDHQPYWVDVEVDHHGIAPGRLLHAQNVPIRGLTIRIKFDDHFPPEAAWWYAELTEDERYVQPPAGDRHLLPVIGNAVQHTFTEHVCQPREHYGLAFSWPPRGGGT